MTANLGPPLTGAEHRRIPLAHMPGKRAARHLLRLAIRPGLADNAVGLVRHLTPGLDKRRVRRNRLLGILYYRFRHRLAHRRLPQAVLPSVVSRFASLACTPS